MSTRVFWDVDTQVDFMLPHGKLYVPGAERLIPNLARLTGYAHSNGIRIIASSDNHDPEDEELSATPDFTATFPPHCLRGTDGQARIAETRLNNPLVVEPEDNADETLARLPKHRNDLLFHKRHFDVFTNRNLLPVLNRLQVTDVVLYGVALDVCNRYAVEGLLAHLPGCRITVVTDAVQALDEAGRNALLGDWRARGVALKHTGDILIA